MMTETGRESLLIRNARVLLPEGAVEGLALLLAGGYIARVFDSEQRESLRAERVLYLDNLTLMPGFIDIHIHGAAGVDTMTATPDDLHLVGRFLARHGVTAWLPTLVPAPEEDYRHAVRAVERLLNDQHERPAAARVLGLHYEGPFVNSEQCGALRPQFFRTFDAAARLDSLPLVSANGAVRMMTVAPEIEGGIELVRELKARGWVVSLGHTRAPVDVLDRAREAGARHMTHFFNAMSPLHHRAPGPIGWGLMSDEMTCDVIADGVHSDPLMLRLLLRCKTSERVSLISDAVAPAGLGDGQYHLWGETITVAGGRTQNSHGHIAGSVITLSDAVRIVLSLGVSVDEIARMGATNPAALLCLDHEYGTIKEGGRADLVALDEDGNVRLTIVGGRVAFDAEL
jgi:N-acetylglucosamine-6-phosphate deacetylase